MKSSLLKALFFLTLGCVGMVMGLALDKGQFQLLLGQHLHDAKYIGMAMTVGPLAGVLVPPIGGYCSDLLLHKGVPRQTLLKLCVAFALLSMVPFLFPLSLPLLIACITIFYIGFNLIIVNYRALITETTNRQSLLKYKGTVSGLFGLFSGLGSCAMFAFFSWTGSTPIAAMAGMAIGLLTFGLLFFYAPKPKVLPKAANEVSEFKQVDFLRPLNILFYLVPWISLLPGIEDKLVQTKAQRPIFRIFVTMSTLWFGAGAIKFFFMLFATKSLHFSAQDASLPMIAYTAATVLGSFPLGKLADKVDSRFLFRCALLCYGLACLMGFFFLHTLPVAIVMMGLVGLGFAGILTVPLSMIFKLCPAKSEGTYLGLFNLFICMPQVYSLILTGMLVDAVHDYRMILLVSATCMAGALILTMRLHGPETVVKEVETAQPIEAIA